jgi:hypothetical protein
VAVTFGAIATTTSAAFLASTAVAGVGFGLAFLGAGVATARFGLHSTALVYSAALAALAAAAAGILLLRPAASPSE